MLAVANRSSDTITIDIDDVQDYDSALAEAIENNTRRYTEMFARAVDDIAVSPTVDLQEESVLDVFISHRNILRQNAVNAAEEPSEINRQRYPPALLRRYQVVFKPSSMMKQASIRQIDAGL